MIEAILQAFIDEVNDEYYVSYECDGGNDVIELTDTDMVLLPFKPSELKQSSIRVW